MFNKLGSTALEQRPDEESEETRSYTEVEHDLFNSVIDKDQVKRADPSNPSRHNNNNDHSDREPSSGPSDTVPARLEQHPDNPNAANTVPARREQHSDNPNAANTVPARREQHSNDADAATPSYDSADSANTVRGAGVKRSPKRKTIVDEDEPMDDGELADSESDVNMEEPLDKQIVSSFAKSK